jgi:hypothetical protein
MITRQYEEYKPIRQIWAWPAIILLSIMTMGWGMVMHMAVPEVVRHWDFGVLPDTPGQSAYATLPPPDRKVVPPQIELPADLLPENRQPLQNE